MRQVVVALIFLLISLNLGAQSGDWYEIKFEKGIGTMLIKNRDFDTVWNASLQSLALDKFKIRVAEKEGKTINAYKDPSFSYNYEIQITFMVEEGSVSVMAFTAPLRKYDGLGGLLQQAASEKRYVQKFFDKLIKTLAQ